MRRIITLALWLAAAPSMADEPLGLAVDAHGHRAITVERSSGGGTVVRDASGRTVGRVVRETGGLAVRDRRGRTVGRIVREVGGGLAVRDPLASVA